MISKIFIQNKLNKFLASDLKKIKKGLSIETSSNKQMIRSYLKYSLGEASKKEMDEANQQFLSFLKTLGLGTMAVLPFAPLTIPVIVKLGKKLGINIIPDGFK